MVFTEGPTPNRLVISPVQQHHVQFHNQQGLCVCGCVCACVRRGRHGGWLMVIGCRSVKSDRSRALIGQRSLTGRRQEAMSLPAIVFNHVSQLDDELPLLVLLTALKCMFLQHNMLSVNNNNNTTKTTTTTPQKH